MRKNKELGDYFEYICWKLSKSQTTHSERWTSSVKTTEYATPYRGVVCSCCLFFIKTPLSSILSGFGEIAKAGLAGEDTAAHCV